jgi:hypothetical protein
MNTSLRFFVVCAVGLFPIAGIIAEDQVKPPSFLKVGNRYRFSFATGGERPWNFGKVVEFGPGPWMRVQLLVPDEPSRRLTPAAGAPAPGTVLAEDMFNLKMLTAVIPADQPTEVGPSNVASPQSAATFPKVGKCYFFGPGFASLPYFAKVLEIGEGNWFRVQEMNPRFVKDQQPRSAEKQKQWWINGTFVTNLREAKPEELPE